MVGAAKIGRQVRVVELVKLIVCKSDGKGLDGIRATAGHESNHGTRIHAAAEKRSQGNVALHTAGNGVGSQSAEFRNTVVEPRLAARLELWRPIATQARTVPAHGEAVGRLELVDALVDGVGVGDIGEAQEIGDRARVEGSVKPRALP